MAIKRKIKAVIFDYDGVLNDSLATLKAVWNEFYNRGLSTKYFKTDEEFSNGFQGDPKKNLTSVGVREEDLEKCDKVIRDLLPLLDKDTELYHRADEVLRLLKNEGYKIGIVSNSLKENIKYKLKKYSIDHCVSSIISTDDVSKPKPSPEGILKCMKELKVKPSQTLYIGDMESDVKAAKAANVRIIAARYGYLSLAKDQKEKLKGADAFADTIFEVYERIKNG